MRVQAVKLELLSLVKWTMILIVSNESSSCKAGAPITCIMDYDIQVHDINTDRYFVDLIIDHKLNTDRYFVDFIIDHKLNTEHCSLFC
jgi:hypothetical protein